VEKNIYILYNDIIVVSRQDKSRSADDGEESRGRNHVDDGLDDEERFIIISELKKRKAKRARLSQQNI
jgi:hypothetical protein